jgi:beta-glucosidase-like glycosyl hydrolase
MPALRWHPDTGFAHESPAIDRGLALGVGGFIIFGVPGARDGEIAALTAELGRRAGRALLIGADLERGAGQQARRAVECPPPRALASLDDPEVVRWAGRTTALEARRLGINWVFAPDCDLDCEPENPIVQTRSFGEDPATVGRLAGLWIEACQGEGVLACAKHYPGHGRTAVDSHDRLPVVTADAPTLERTDELPFVQAIGAGVASVMTAHVAFPALDPAGRAATLSPPILGRLRHNHRFEGLIVSDALVMEGARAGRSEAELAVEAVAAGCDMLLYPRDVEAAIRGLEAASAGPLAGRMAESLARYSAAVATAESPSRPAAERPPGLHEQARSIADRLLAAGMRRGEAPRFDHGLRFDIIDDDLAGWYKPGPSDLVPRGLARRGRGEVWSGARVVLAFASPKAAKGRAGFSPENRAALTRLAGEAALVVLFGHPRLVEEIPPGPPVLVAWHRQDLMQDAVARWLVARVAA